MDRHTPQPWTLWVDASGAFQINAGDKLIVQRGPMGDREEGLANAHLFYAAPDLLEALEQCLRYIELDETTHGRPFAAGNVARAALAKAKVQ